MVDPARRERNYDTGRRTIYTSHIVFDNILSIWDI